MKIEIAHHRDGFYVCPICARQHYANFFRGAIITTIETDAQTELRPERCHVCDRQAYFDTHELVEKALGDLRRILFDFNSLDGNWPIQYTGSPYESVSIALKTILFEAYEDSMLAYSIYEDMLDFSPDEVFDFDKKAMALRDVADDWKYRDLEA